ncbi:MAG: VacJ family lipoprotein [Methylococcales bacterium]|nr:VacJ family lipoprotein [Methylococcales bacterium]MDD5755383.1 VacJ family lipoprotein [Methylococcales bacterium]
MTLRKIFTTGCVLLSVACSTAPIKKETAAQKNPDTFEDWNRSIHSFNEGLDAAILKPIAKGYMWVAPDLVEKGVTNFFSNINDIGVTVNDLLQFKMTQSGMDASRFIINTTAGGLGVFDVAEMIDLPKHNEDFGQTLGFWGVPAGDFLMLPFVGPSSPREVAGMVGDALLNPFSYTFLFGGGIAVTAATSGIKSLDVTNTRANLMGTEKMVNEAATDKYNFIKNAYQQRREYLVHDGNVPAEDDIDLLEDEESSAPPPKSTPPILNKSSTKLNSSVPAPTPSNLPTTVNKSRRFLELSAPK